MGEESNCKSLTAANPIFVKFILNACGILTQFYCVPFGRPNVNSNQYFLGRDVYTNVKANDVKCIAASV